MLELLAYGFVLRALVAASIAAVLSAVVGSFAVLRNMSTIGAALAHASLAGALLAFALGVDPSLGATALSAVFALAAAYSGEGGSSRAEASLGVAFGFSAALAALALSLTREYALTAYSYLLGEVLGVTEGEVVALSLLATASLILIALFYKELKFTTFDSEAAEAMGIRTRLYHYMLVLLVAATVVVELKVVGSILAVIFLVAPAAAALELSHSLESMIALSIFFALLSSIAGLLASLALDVPTSPAIGLIAAGIYLACLVLSRRKRCCSLR